MRLGDVVWHRPSMSWTLEEFRGSPPEWDALAASFSDFTPMQSYAWGAARSEEGWTVRRDVWRDESGSPVAAAAVLLRRRFGVRIAYMSRGPLVLRDGQTRPDAARQFGLCIAEYRRRLAFGEILLCSVYPTLADIDPETIAGTGLRPLFPTTGVHGISSIVSLPEPDALVRRSSSDWRNRFRRSEARLANVRRSAALDDLRRARRLVAQLERDKGFTTSVPDALISALAGSGAQVFFVEDESGAMTAAVLVAVAGRRAFRVLAGVAPEETRSNPGTGRVLEVAVTRWAHEAGLVAYDVEGLNPENRGVWDFKFGMRGTMFASAGLHAVSRPRAVAAAYSYYRRRGWTTAAHIWRTSPSYFASSAWRSVSRGAVDSRRMRVYLKALSPPGPSAPPAGFTFAVLDTFDPELFRYRLATVRELWGRIELLRRDSVECGIVSCRDGYAAAYGFLRRETAPLPEVGETLTLDPTDAYVYDCFVLPQFRGQRLYPYLLTELCAHAHRRGVKRAFIAVDAGNAPSVRGIESAGFTHDRTARYRRFGPFRSVVWEGAAS